MRRGKSIEKEFVNHKTMETDNIMQSFLRQLITHNNREWFKAHRDLYDAAWGEFTQLTARLIEAIAIFDPSVSYLTPKDCQFRIYRDIRFSADKTPYKGHFGTYINEKGKKSYYGGYYIQIEPRKVMVAGGVWWLPTKEMHALRHAIVDQAELFHGIIQDPELQNRKPTLGLNYYKRIPNGYPKDFPYPEYLLPKDYTISFDLPDDVLQRPDAVQIIADYCQAMKPFNDFITENIEINLEEMESMRDVVKFL